MLPNIRKMIPALKIKDLNTIKVAFQLTEIELQFLITLYQRSHNNPTYLLAKLLKDWPKTIDQTLYQSRAIFRGKIGFVEVKGFFYQISVFFDKLETPLLLSKDRTLYPII